MDKQNMVYPENEILLSAIKKNEVWTHARTLLNLENTMLNKRTQTQKATY